MQSAPSKNERQVSTTDRSVDWYRASNETQLLSVSREFDSMFGMPLYGTTVDRWMGTGARPPLGRHLTAIITWVLCTGALAPDETDTLILTLGRIFVSYKQQENQTWADCWKEADMPCRGRRDRVYKFLDLLLKSFLPSRPIEFKSACAPAMLSKSSEARPMGGGVASTTAGSVPLSDVSEDARRAWARSATALLRHSTLSADANHEWVVDLLDTVLTGLHVTITDPNGLAAAIVETLRMGVDVRKRQAAEWIQHFIQERPTMDTRFSPCLQVASLYHLGPTIVQLLSDRQPLTQEHGSAIRLLVQRFIRDDQFGADKFGNAEQRCALNCGLDALPRQYVADPPLVQSAEAITVFFKSLNVLLCMKQDSIHDQWFEYVAVKLARERDVETIRAEYSSSDSDDENGFEETDAKVGVTSLPAVDRVSRAYIIGLAAALARARLPTILRAGYVRDFTALLDNGLQKYRSPPAAAAADPNSFAASVKHNAVEIQGHAAKFLKDVVGQNGIPKGGCIGVAVHHSSTDAVSATQLSVCVSALWSDSAYPWLFAASLLSRDSTVECKTAAAVADPVVVVNIVPAIHETHVTFLSECRLATAKLVWGGQAPQFESYFTRRLQIALGVPRKASSDVRSSHPPVTTAAGQWGPKVHKVMNTLYTENQALAASIMRSQATMPPTADPHRAAHVPQVSTPSETAAVATETVNPRGVPVYGTRCATTLRTAPTPVGPMPRPFLAATNVCAGSPSAAPATTHAPTATDVLSTAQSQAPNPTTAAVQAIKAPRMTRGSGTPPVLPVPTKTQTVSHSGRVTRMKADNLAVLYARTIGELLFALCQGTSAAVQEHRKLQETSSATHPESDTSVPSSSATSSLAAVSGTSTLATTADQKVRTIVTTAQTSTAPLHVVSKVASSFGVTSSGAIHSMLSTLQQTPLTTALSVGFQTVAVADALRETLGDAGYWDIVFGYLEHASQEHRVLSFMRGRSADDGDGKADSDRFGKMIRGWVQSVLAFEPQYARSMPRNRDVDQQLAAVVQNRSVQQLPVHAFERLWGSEMIPPLTDELAQLAIAATAKLIDSPRCVEATLFANAPAATHVYAFRFPGRREESAPDVVGDLVEHSDLRFSGFHLTRPCAVHCQVFAVAYRLLRTLLLMR